MILLAACASPKRSSSLGDAGVASAARAPVQQLGPVASLDPTAAVATINGVPVTGKDLDDAIRADISKETDSYLEQVQKLREDGLDELIAEKLIEMEAKSRGLSTEELVKQEIGAKTPAPSEDELKAFYDKIVKPQYDVPYEHVKAEISAQLMRQKSGDRAKAYFVELRAKYKVKVTLPVRRVEVAATGPSRGPAGAKVTIVEFSDFECPYCGRAIPTIEVLLKKYEGKLRFVFREFPLPMHKYAPKAAEAALCANEQGKFWPMYDAMFSHQEKLELADLKGYAKGLGIDATKFDTCLDSGRMGPAVQADVEAGKVLGIDGTPAFYINGRPYSGALPIDKFEEVIDSELNAG